MGRQQRAAVPDGLAVDREPPAALAAPGRNGTVDPVGLAVTRLRPYDAAPPPEPDVEPLLRKMKHRNPKADLVLVRRAYAVANERHGGQLRKSGQLYIAHPLGVAEIVADLGLDTTSVIAALLHDVVEDTSMTLEEVSSQFGAEVGKITDGLTKLDRIGFETREAAQAETIRKMVVAMARDIRVLLIKLADRLHNMRDIGYLPREKQECKARETLEIYAPLANRLGMHQVKWELEDLAFAALFPKRYEEIVRMTTERQPEREHYLANVIDQVNAQLKTLKIRAEVTGRPKHYYSIYEKMVLRGKEFSDIFDLVGVRVLTDSIKDCYAALGQVHALWKPVPGRFKDYIAMPKFNLYQSLHTTVVGPEGKPLEIQIRTKAMHQTAEYGIAAHWRYKSKDVKGNPPTEQEMGWLRQLIDWQRELSDPKDFIDNLKTDLYVDEVFVFTPKGDVLQLPAGGTPIDFAYAVHTEVGHRCVGARVNKRLVPLEYTLQNGDTVEIFTSKAPDAGPSRDWLGIVKTPRARNKIRQWFSKERREDAIEAGKEALVRAMRKGGLPLQRLTQGGALAALASEMRFPTLEALYAAVGTGQVTAAHVVGRLKADLGEEEQEDEELPLRRATRPVRPLPASRGVVVKGVDDVWVKLARCCTPVPRDPIMGFITRGHGVSVHRSDCPNAADLRRHPNRMIEVGWDTSGPSVFAVTIQVEALDRTKLLRDITEVLSDHHVNIVSATVATGRDRIATLRFTFELADISHLAHVLSSVKRVDGVYDAFRVVPHGNGQE
ncbi:MAG TPA: bifunctional (p)ppGpp synthetase/guanosine-3',5'-bis(diphosphate) 3'-pyrophosphohydrolase [Actinomycetes bacterium]|jgi:GTP pyrophosphokinase|nr:bifunctional (p)ppGpp synthetase/guanosine-3',5'-bis(diphosphate) 3'-pyrophosphohydrolase [Actinomycetes bacterium]